MVILWLSLSLVASLLGGIAKIARHFDAKPDTAHELSDQVAALDQKLGGVEAKLGNQLAIRADLAKVQADVKQLVKRNSRESKWSWWEEGLQPIVIIAFLWLFFKNKNLLTEQAAPSNGG